MTANELRELADALSIPTAYTYGPTEPQRKRIADYLRACADALEAGPVAWRREVRGTGTHGYRETAWGHYGTTTSTDEARKHEGRSGNGLECRSVPLYPVAMPAKPVSVADELPQSFGNPEQLAIPAGWKLVPVEPTLGMSEAGAHSTGDNVDGRPVWKATIDEQAAHIYRAMLAAAPTPPVATLRLPEPMTGSEISDYARAMVKGDRSVDWLAMQIEAEVIRRVKECNE